MRRSCLLVMLIASSSAQWSAAEELFPLGGEFQVNSYTTGTQRLPAVAVDSAGGFVVVWQSSGSYGSDTDSFSIQGQRFGAGGSPLGSEFQINWGTAGTQYSPDVAMAANADFLVAWHSDSSLLDDGSGTSIQAARFNADGSAFTLDLQVNSYTTGDQLSAAVATTAADDFVVVWQSAGSSGTDPGASIQGQLLHHNGGVLGAEFQVNSFTLNDQSGADVAVDSLGRFVMVWQSAASGGSDTDSTSIHAQRFDASGVSHGSELQVNSYTTGKQLSASVAPSGFGGFVVVWHSAGSSGTDSEGYSIQARRYSSSGIPLGSEFQVNSYTTGYQESPAVASLGEAGFIVVWQSDGSSGTDHAFSSVQGQLYDANGAPAGGQFQVNSVTPSSQGYPQVAANDRGHVVVVWEGGASSGTDHDATSINGQHYLLALFYDGFETGDTSAWTRAVP